MGRDYRVLRCYPAACPCGHEASGWLHSRCDAAGGGTALRTGARAGARIDGDRIARCPTRPPHALSTWREADARPGPFRLIGGFGDERDGFGLSRSQRSEEHTSELQSLMRISYDVFC